jgi:nickel transport protein
MQGKGIVLLNGIDQILEEKMKHKLLGGFLLVVMVLYSFTEVLAHGVVAGYTKKTGIEITAQYDTGHPLSEAQVDVFAPNQPTVPWLKSELDENGRFSFVPDDSIPGTWSVQVRHLGHGAMIHIPLGESGIQDPETGSAASMSPLQRIVIAACVLWGGIGTTLYFSRRKKTEEKPTSDTKNL